MQRLGRDFSTPPYSHRIVMNATKTKRPQRMDEKIHGDEPTRNAATRNQMGVGIPGEVRFQTTQLRLSVATSNSDFDRRRPNFKT